MSCRISSHSPAKPFFFSCSLLFIGISFYSVDKDKNLGVSFDTFFSLIFLHLITPSTSISTSHIFLKSFLSLSDTKTHVHHSFPSNAPFLPTAPRVSQPSQSCALRYQVHSRVHHLPIQRGRVSAISRLGWSTTHHRVWDMASYSHALLKGLESIIPKSVLLTLHREDTGNKRDPGR